MPHVCCYMQDSDEDWERLGNGEAEDIEDVVFSDVEPTTPAAGSMLSPKTTPPPAAPSAEELHAAAKEVWL